MAYLKWDQKTITDFTDENIDALYDQGYVFGRLGKGTMDQTRSVRINLDFFDLSSENRRVMKKTEGLELQPKSIPFEKYHWSIGKLGKDFYDLKFGEKTFSANKLKEIITLQKESNFNKLFIYNFNGTNVGYAVCRNTEHLLHYCYPFYQLESEISNLGLGMMLRAILWAKETNHQYIYLGSAQRSGDVYKLQFEGLEWFDGKEWCSDLEMLKKLLKN